MSYQQARDDFEYLEALEEVEIPVPSGVSVRV